MFIEQFDDLSINEKSINKLKTFFNDNQIPMNINIKGNEGYGKKTIINCILKKCFDTNLNNFSQYISSKYIFSYNDIMFIPYYVLTNSEINLIIDEMKKFIKYKSLFSPYKIIILDNIDKLNKQFVTFLNCFCESPKVRFITTSNSNKKNINKYITTCWNFNLSYLNQDEFKKYILKKKIKIPKKHITKLYKSYQVNNYNLKYINYILDNEKDQLFDELSITKNEKKDDNKIIISENIINKFAISLLNLCINYNTTNLEKIRNKLYLINSLGIDYTELLKSNLRMIIKNKNIDNSIKHEIILLTSNINYEILYSDRFIFYLEKYYFDISKLLNEKKK